jgi:hypothetical protein
MQTKETINRSGVVGIATCYGLDGRGSDHSRGRGFLHPYILALSFT